MASSKLVVATALSLFGSGAGVAVDARQEHIISMPMHQFPRDCGTKSRLRVRPEAAALLQEENLPGAGIDKFTPFSTVLKDGFMLVDCVKDYMYYHGDKFGKNKYDYKLGSVSNVSIVHYNEFVAKEDRQEMTQKVCFQFCRTVPNMGFFGIANGRNCYCTPYFQQMAGDSSQCDAVCPGDNTLMCGGNAKSSIFAMHMCDSTQVDLSTRADAAESLKSSMEAKVAQVKGFSTDMQEAGANFQASFGKVGDSAATDLCQDAKKFAGTLQSKAEDAERVATKLGELKTEASGITDFTDPAAVTKASRVMEDLDETTADGEKAADELDELASKVDPAGTMANLTYYPVMYFVDKEFTKVPSTCTGSKVGVPMLNLDAKGCAAACDAAVGQCVGFQLFQDNDARLCFLLGSFKTGSYYTGCGDSAAFLQKSKAAPFEAGCYAKFSKFEGTTLKPDGSGKCEQCFDTLTKADRCY